MNEDEAWGALLALARHRRRCGAGRGPLAVWHDAAGRLRVGGRPETAPALRVSADGRAAFAPTVSPAARTLLERYLPLAAPGRRARLVVAHLGQSLDGRIAATNGASRWVTGPEDLTHNHRMRALFDAVVVGAGTVRHDDPQLTVRLVAGGHPARVVLDARRTLGPNHGVFTDGRAPTLLLCAEELAGGTGAGRVGRAEVVGVPVAADGTLDHRAVLDRLAARSLRRVFVEGGGVTVSRFLRAGCLHRLQITVAPVLIGSGRPGIHLPEVGDLSACLRPRTRRFELGDDVLFECILDDDDDDGHGR